MSGAGQELFNVSQGYDESAWDDRELIRQYEEALESSRRELKRSQKSKDKNWKIGDACRAVYSEDGEEYEGTVVSVSPAKRCVRVRFHGYNNEEEVKTKNVYLSLGQEAVDEQLLQAEYDMALESESTSESESSRQWRVGDNCRAEWSVDGVTYEGVIEAVSKKRGTASVRFLGYGNRGTVQLTEVRSSRGEAARLEQEEQALVDASLQMAGKFVTEDVLVEGELGDVMVEECTDLIDSLTQQTENLDLLKTDALTSTGKKKRSKTKKEDTDNSSFTLPGYPQTAPVSSFMPARSSPNSSSVPQVPMGWLPPPPPSLPPLAPHFPPPPPPPTALQPDLDGAASDVDSKALHSMLLSWYMAGYHSGYYQGLKENKNKTENRSTKKKI